MVNLRVKLTLVNIQLFEMMKIKLNIKSTKQNQSPTQTLNFTAIKQIEQFDSNIKKVIPYEEDEVLEPYIENQYNKIILKPKISIGSKIKINVKKNNSLQSAEYNSNEDEDDDEDDDENENENENEYENEYNKFSIEPKLVLKNNTPQTIVKINVKKKTETPKVYKSLILDQKPIKKFPNEPFNIFGKIELESFYEDGQIYYIDWKSKYIFPSDIDTHNSLLESFDLEQPIGKLIDTPWVAEDFLENKYPLIKRKIEWFYHYELDADALN